jgi:menaquinol-cytochrome c reductase iron-sulfur subunit
MDQDKKNKGVSRREALGTMGKAVAGGAIVLSGIGGITYLDKNIKKAQATQNKGKGNLAYIGEENDFANISGPMKVDYEVEVEDGWVTQNIKGFVYVTKDDKNKLLIMSPVCTHLGCSVPFAAEDKKKDNSDLTFLCPCHQGQYDDQGINIGGPPPRPLDVFKPVIKDGKVYIYVLSPVRRYS